MRYVLVKDPAGRLGEFAVNPLVTNGIVRYSDAATHADNVTLLQDVLAYEQSSEIRDIQAKRARYVRKGRSSSIVCANAIIDEPSGAIFVERPGEFVYDEASDCWSVEEGPNTKFYRKSDGFVMPKDGYAVPVPAGDGTAKLMLYHPDTGMPFKTVRNRVRAVELLVCYLHQIWDMDGNAFGVASDDLSMFWAPHKGYVRGASVVKHLSYDNEYGPRAIECSGGPSNDMGNMGTRRFRTPTDEDREYFAMVKEARVRNSMLVQFGG